MLKKKLFLIIVLPMLFVASTIGQNLQLHYDSRHTLHGGHFLENYFTATFEMFKLDKWGSTYLFVDLDMSHQKGGIGQVYTEVMRDQKIGKLPVLAHLEFNGGFFNGGQISNSYLTGLSYPTRVGKFNLSTYLAYKYNAFDKVSHDIQWTGIWGGTICNDKITISGFVDVWTENKRVKKVDTERGKKVVIVAEPQFWYNVTSNFSLGTEIEISNNFCFSEKTSTKDRAFVNPTIAAKWNF